MLVLAWILFVCCRQSSATPCTYQDEVYQDGDTVNTSEPCLNCTCNSGVLLCYLRVCTTVLPSPLGCMAQKLPGDCCPQTVCDFKEGDIVVSNNSQVPHSRTKLKPMDGPLELTTEPMPTISTDLLTTDFQNQTSMLITSTSSLSYNDIEGGCYLNGSLYAEGSAMMSPSFCHYCYCIRGKQVCLQPKCHLTIEGCKARYLSEFTCCPTHYDCGDDDGGTNTTETVSTSNLLPSTTLAGESGCIIDDYTYSVGDAVPSMGECKTCYCSRNGVICSPLQCSPVMEGCIPVIPEGHCCPVQYTCNFTQESLQQNIESVTWGIGEIQEISTHEGNKSNSFTTDFPLPVALSSFFTTMVPLASQSFLDTAEDRHGDILLPQNEAILSDITESTLITTPDFISTVQQQQTTTITRYLNNTESTEATSDLTPVSYDQFASQKVNTSEDDLLEITPITDSFYSMEVSTSDATNVTVATDDANSTIFTTEDDIEITTTETNSTVTDSTQEESSFLEVSTEGKRFRLQDPSRHLPPPFLFLGTRLAVRPVPLSAPTRTSNLRATQKPIQRNTVSIQGTCAIGSRIFMNGELVIHTDPCEICRCISGREICHRQKCLPPPSSDCKREKSPGFCCPHYICINPPPFDISATPTRNKAPIGISEGHKMSVMVPVEHKPPENIPIRHKTQVIIPEKDQLAEMIPEYHRNQERIKVEHKIPHTTRFDQTTPNVIEEQDNIPPIIISHKNRVPVEHRTPTVTAEKTTTPISNDMNTNNFEEETSTESQSVPTIVTTKSSLITVNSTSPLKVNTPSRLSFLDHLLSLMGSNTGNITQRPIPQNAVPGSLVGNSWGVLRVSGCNVYGRYYVLHERIPQLSTDCKICICDSTGVNCNSIC